MLTYPAWCSPVDRELIDAALRAVCPPVSFALGAPDPGPSPWVAEPVAVQNVLRVAQAVASCLPDPFPDDRRHDLDVLLAQIIHHVAKRRGSPKSPLETFEATVQNTLSASAWWPCPDPPPVPGAPIDAHSALSWAGAAERLGVTVDTLQRMVHRNEIQTVTVGKRRKLPAAEIERVLASPAFRRDDR